MGDVIIIKTIVAVISMRRFGRFEYDWWVLGLLLLSCVDSGDLSTTGGVLGLLLLPCVESGDLSATSGYMGVVLLLLSFLDTTSGHVGGELFSELPNTGHSANARLRYPSPHFEHTTLVSDGGGKLRNP